MVVGVAEDLLFRSGPGCGPSKPNMDIQISNVQLYGGRQILPALTR